MTTAVRIQERHLERDEDGYLRNIDDWSINVAEELAREEGIEDMSSRHWKLVTAIRFHYEKNGESPLCRDILIEAGFTKMDMYSLFPPSGYRSAYKVAGLPKPIEC